MRRLLLATFIATGALFVVAGPASAAKFMVSVVQDDNRLIYSNASARLQTLNRAKLLGADAVRVSVLWDAVAPRKRPKRGQDPKAFQAVAKRYSGTYKDENEGKGVLPRVAWWGIGNEPNQGGWLMPQARRIGGHLIPTSPGIYRQLLVAGAGALIRTGHSSDTVNIG